MHHRIATGLLLAALPLAVACGNGAAAGSGPAPAAPASGQRVTIKGLDSMKFEPATITVKAGQPVELTFENTGALVHDLTLTQGVSPQVEVVAPGQAKRTVTFTVDKPGSYAFICMQPGHESAGMKGTLIAQ